MKKIPELRLDDDSMIPVFGIGTWQLKGETCTKAVREALELGYRHIDTADFYGNHQRIREAIDDFDRSRLFITSKIWRSDLKHDDVLSSGKRILDELGIDYLDLLLIHWPNSDIPVEETLKAMKKLKEDGKIRAIGVSNFTIEHLKEAIDSGVEITNNQVEFHPMLYQKKLLEFCKENNIVLTAYSPIARGHVFDIPLLKELGEKYDKSPAQISLRWIIQKDIVAIPKASSEDHLKENIDIFDFRLTDEDMKKIDDLDKQRRLVDPGFSEF